MSYIHCRNPKYYYNFAKDQWEIIDKDCKSCNRSYKKLGNLKNELAKPGTIVPD